MAAPVLPPPTPARPRLTSIASGFAGGVTAMFFAGLIGFYLTQRAATLGAGQEWLAGSEIPLTQPNVMLFGLLMSVVTMQWAYYSIVRDDRQNAYVALGLTLLFAIAYVNAQAYLYTRMQLVIADSFDAVLVYTITGAHLAITAGAMVYLAVVTFRALGGRYSPTQSDGVAGAAIYWYVVVGIYAVIWYAIYVVK